MKMKSILFGILFSLIILSPAFAASSWNLQINTADPRLLGVYAVSDTTLTAVGTEGVVTKSTDRGVTWLSSTIGAANYTWYGIAYPSSTVGYIAGTKGPGTNAEIYKTTNGGTNWSQIFSLGAAQIFYDVFFATENIGWAVGTNQASPPLKVYRTTDGGLTTPWSTADLSWGNNAFGIHAAYDSSQSVYRVWVVGENGNISRSTDSGATFSNQTSGTANDLIDVFFIDKDTGWVVGDGGTILKTTNGGTNWTAQTSSTTEGLNGVHFVSSTTGFVVGNNGKILSTTDGGATWTAETSGTPANLYRVYFYDAYNGWAVGGNSRVALIREEANISSFSQNSAAQGSTGVTVNIGGTGFKAGMTPSFSGSGITVTSTTITSATEMSVTFDIAAGAATGSRDYRLLTAAGNLLTFSNRFTVTSSSPSVVNPTITSTSQSILTLGNTYTLVLTGTGFQTGAALTINGITPNSTTVDSSTQITARVTVPSAHATGLFNITVANTDGGAATLANSIIISSASGGPTVTELVTNYGYRGAISSVIVNGTGFANNSQVLFSGSGITGTVTYISSTQLRVAVAIGADGSIGAQTVTVFNPTDSTVGALENAFTVKAASTSGKVIINVVVGPNPIKAGTTVANIQGEATTAPLTLDIPVFDSSGRMIARLTQNLTSPGRFSIPWNFLTNNINPPSNGTSIILLNTNNTNQQRVKVVFAR
ncbi:MAG: YCF48-related protein [Candidatus Margulisiibacteriota bacterium]